MVKLKIFVTGDTHGGLDSEKLSFKNFPEGQTLTKDDFVIVLGDFGYIFYKNPDSNKEFFNLNKIEKFPWTTLFIDGNHENHERLNQYPVENWNGGRIHKIRDSIFHLMRGEIFNLGEKLFFCMGGAGSIDKESRVTGFSWWKEEIPSYQEMDYALGNLEKVNNKVDFILTHTCPRCKILEMEKMIFEDSLIKFFDEIYKNVDFSNWYFGHFHKDIVIPSDNRLKCLYQSVIRIL